MANKLYNLAGMSTPTTGPTPTVTLGAALSGGYLSFADAGAEDGDVVTVAFQDGGNAQICQAQYVAPSTLNILQVYNSTNGGNLISLSGNAQVFVTAAASDLPGPQGLQGPQGAQGAKGDTGAQGPQGASGSGSGDVNGPATSVDNHVALFDGATGTLLKDGGAPLGALAFKDIVSSNIFQVMPNKTIRAPDGSAFIARGATMFDYLLCSFEVRTDDNFRSILDPAGKGPGTGISEPTYYASRVYVSEDHVKALLQQAWNSGANFLRLTVEPAVMFASVSYVDPTDGLTYPSDIDMLHTIVSAATDLGMVVQLQQGRDIIDPSDVATFMTWLAGQFGGNPLVWINPWNEPNGFPPATNVNNVTAWIAVVKPQVSALRAAGWKNPIAIDPPGWATRIDLIDSTLGSDSVFLNDPNLIIDIHEYPQPGDTDFRASRLPTLLPWWVNFLGKYCVKLCEIGINNTGAVLDPNLNPGVGSTNPTEWAQFQAVSTDFLQWANEKMKDAHFGINGTIGTSWGGYLAGTEYDPNAMFKTDGSMTTWGQIFFFNMMSPLYIQDVSGAHVLETIAGLDVKGRVSDGASGTPTFQAEGKTGARDAATFIMQAASDGYVNFHNRTTGASVGTIAGNGGSGVVYNTTSDYRLKTDLTDISPADALALVKALRPYNGTWKETGQREPMLIAHEVQDVAPYAVTGTKDAEKDGKPVYQMIDQTRLIPVLIAAIQALADR